MAIEQMKIPYWHPTRLNKMIGVHWATVQKHKRIDRDIVALYAIALGLKPTSRRRQVSLEITLKPRQRGGDPDAYWKSLLDALVHAKLLRQDSHKWCQLGEITFERGSYESTTIRLEDVA